MAVYKYQKDKWEVVYRNFHKRGFNSKKEAQLYELKIKFNEVTSIDNLYLYTIADDYLDWLEKNTSYSTYDKCYQAMKNIILPMVDNKKMVKITDMDCRKYHEKLIKTNYSSRYKNYLQNKYIAIFKHAQKYYDYDLNPTKYLEPFKKTFEEKQKIKQKEMNVWTDNEFSKFIGYVKDERYKLLYIALYYTGMRIGEAQALTWNDYKDGKLNIDKSLCKLSRTESYEIKDTKTESSMRTISLPSSVVDLFNDRLMEVSKIKGFSSSWFIFGSDKPLPRTTIDRIKDDAIKKSKVKRITIHEFRHSHASNLISQNINIVAISRRLGHSDINITLKVYAHLMPKNEDELLKYLNKSYQNLTKQQKKPILRPKY